MLKVLSDAYAASDAGQVTLLGLLDLIATFDTVDNQILVERLRRTFGVDGSWLDWVISYLTGRTQFVRFNGQTSGVTSVSCGVPQGLVLRPTLFVQYAVDVIPLIEVCGVSMHAYTDNLQVYGHADATQSARLLTQMADCIVRVEVWMATNRLRLNSSKTELICLGSPRRLLQCTPNAIIVSGANIKPSQAIRDFGVIVDGDLLLTAHVIHVTSV